MADLREPAAARVESLARSIAGERRQAGNRGVRRRHALQRQEPGGSRPAEASVPSAIRHGNSECAAGPAQASGIPGRRIEGDHAGRDLVGGRDRAASARREQWCLELGGHLRTGLEDNIKFDKDRLARSNADLSRASPIVRPIRPSCGKLCRGATNIGIAGRVGRLVHKTNGEETMQQSNRQDRRRDHRSARSRSQARSAPPSNGTTSSLRRDDPLVLNKLFFPNADVLISTLLAYGTFFVGFLSRPIGGIIFGHYGTASAARPC